MLFSNDSTGIDRIATNGKLPKKEELKQGAIIQDKSASPADVLKAREKLFFSAGSSIDYYAGIYGRSDMSDSDDLYQDSALGCWIATEKYDPEHQCAFNTYASQWERLEVQRSTVESRAALKIGRDTYEQLKRYKEAENYLRNSYPPDYVITDEEIARISGLSIKQVHFFRTHPSDQVARWKEDEEGNLIEIDSGYETPDDECAGNEIVDKILKVLNSIDPDLKEVFCKKTGLCPQTGIIDDKESPSFARIADDMKIPVSRVKSLYEKAQKILSNRLTN